MNINPVIVELPSTQVSCELPPQSPYCVEATPAKRDGHINLLDYCFASREYIVAAIKCGASHGEIHEWMSVQFRPAIPCSRDHFAATLAMFRWLIGLYPARTTDAALVVQLHGFPAIVPSPGATTGAPCLNAPPGFGASPSPSQSWGCQPKRPQRSRRQQSPSPRPAPDAASSAKRAASEPASDAKTTTSRTRVVPDGIAINPGNAAEFLRTLTRLRRVRPETSVDSGCSQ